MIPSEFEQRMFKSAAYQELRRENNGLHERIEELEAIVAAYEAYAQELEAELAGTKEALADMPCEMVSAALKIGHKELRVRGKTQRYWDIQAPKKTRVRDCEHCRSCRTRAEQAKEPAKLKGEFNRDLDSILHKVQMSLICLADEIHDAKASGDPDVRRMERKYKFWEKIEKILFRAVKVRDEYAKQEEDRAEQAKERREEENSDELER